LSDKGLERRDFRYEEEEGEMKDNEKRKGEFVF